MSTKQSFMTWQNSQYEEMSLLVWNCTHRIEIYVMPWLLNNYCELNLSVIFCIAIYRGQVIISHLTPEINHAWIKAWLIGSYANTLWCYESADSLNLANRSPLPKLMAEWRESAGPQPAATKRHRKAWAGGGEEVSKQQPAVACTFSYWLSLYPLPLCGCQIPYSNLGAEWGPLPCSLISIFPSCLSSYHRDQLISFKGSEHLLLPEMFDSQLSLASEKCSANGSVTLRCVQPWNVSTNFTERWFPRARK